MKEEVREIEDHPGYYISNTGKIYSKWRMGRAVKNGPIYPLREKKCSIHKDGYYYACIKGTCKAVHRYLAIAFIPNPENKSDVNHKDGNKLNNNLDNLEWNTRKENINHAFQMGLSDTTGHVAGIKNGNHILNDKLVLEIREKAKQGHTCSELAREYSVSKSNIVAIKNRKSWKHI